MRFTHPDFNVIEPDALLDPPPESPAVLRLFAAIEAVARRDDVSFEDAVAQLAGALERSLAFERLMDGFDVRRRPECPPSPVRPSD
jgi:hypothetical protein